MDRAFESLGISRLARMVEISQTLNSATNLDELLTYIIKEAADFTNTEAASILLLDPFTQQLFIKASSNDLAPEMYDTPVPLDNSIAGVILQENRPVYIPDVASDPRWNQNVDEAIEFQTREILGVPMHNAHRQPVGVLEAINKKEGTFDRKDIETLSVLADLAGVAVEKARLIEELSELDQLKTDFIAIASHELRTPLAIILGYASYLRQEAPPEMAGLLDSVLGGANRLQALIQEMLNFQYTLADEDTLDLTLVNFVELVQDVLDSKEEAATARQHTVTAVLPKELIWTEVDTETMQVALGNLIDNAIKFTPEGGQIEVRVEKQKNEVWFTVADNGIGIPKNQLDRIFKRFYQVEDHMRRRHGGLGLGLAISKELVELHDGRIWVESRLDVGSKFFVALKLSKQA